MRDYVMKKLLFLLGAASLTFTSIAMNGGPARGPAPTNSSSESEESEESDSGNLVQELQEPFSEDESCPMRAARITDTYCKIIDACGFYRFCCCLAKKLGHPDSYSEDSDNENNEMEERDPENY
jgi:hypothetical protein